jgi:hypothetical protein
MAVLKLAISVAAAGLCGGRSGCGGRIGISRPQTSRESTTMNSLNERLMTWYLLSISRHIVCQSGKKAGSPAGHGEFCRTPWPGSAMVARSCAKIARQAAAGSQPGYGMKNTPGNGFLNMPPRWGFGIFGSGELQICRAYGAEAREKFNTPTLHHSITPFFPAVFTSATNCARRRRCSARSGDARPTNRDGREPGCLWR